MDAVSPKTWYFGLLLAALLAASSAPANATGLYPWTPAENASSTLSDAIKPPSGFERTAAAPGSFAAWLRALPVKAQGAPVNLFNGTPKARQDVHAAVIDIDAGKRDLQQCADAVMRLRAEWLFASNRKSDIGFNFTSGLRVPYARYAKGERPSADGKSWNTSAKPDDSYQSFRRYMDLIFAYAGTASLEKELKPVADAAAIQTGDVFIKGGFPGHAVIVADMAEHPLTKSKRFLLIQSYMPAQDMHVLKNPANGDGSPWYAVPSGSLVTPEWTFQPGSLRRWP
ncbi:MAG: DUF4846 domain-containing protein [Hyphomicrobium sp.]